MIPVGDLYDLAENLLDRDRELSMESTRGVDLPCQHAFKGRRCSLPDEHRGLHAEAEFRVGLEPLVKAVWDDKGMVDFVDGWRPVGQPQRWVLDGHRAVVQNTDPNENRFPRSSLAGTGGSRLRCASTARNPRGLNIRCERPAGHAGFHLTTAPAPAVEISRPIDCIWKDTLWAVEVIPQHAATLFSPGDSAQDEPGQPVGRKPRRILTEDIGVAQRFRSIGVDLSHSDDEEVVW